MATIVYADAALQTGDNNGTSWENAYRGCAGLQTALDNVADGSDTVIYIRNTFLAGTYGSTIDIDTAGGDYTNNHWLKIIGCDNISGNPLPKGQYVILDGENLIADHLMNISNVSMVHIENVHFTRISTETKAGCYLNATEVKYGYNFVNCKFSYCPYGLFTLSTTCHRDLFVNECVFSNNSNRDIYSAIRSTVIISSRFNSANNSAIRLVSSGIIQGCSFEYTANSGTVILENPVSSDANTIIISDCTFYCTGLGGVTAINSNNLVGLVVANNIFYFAVPASDIPILAARMGYEEYNCTNTTVNLLAGSHSLNGADPQFADAANGNFRPRNPAVLRGGMPDISGNPTQIGAIGGKYQFISKAKQANHSRISIFR